MTSSTSDRRDLRRGRRRSSTENLEKLDKAGIDRSSCSTSTCHTGPWIRNTLKADKNENRDHALFDIYRVMRPGEPPTRETAEALFAVLFFDKRAL
jgi:DNA-directed RNA polymerase subunit beta